MELEFHQLELRYEHLRACRPERERRLLASLAERGQQVPIVVVASEEADRFVVVDGYKRVRALRRLARDTVSATCWELGEAEALLLGRLMRTADGETALEQGWLLQELHGRFGLSIEELARRFDRSASWVSRRLGLVRELPEPIQQHVVRGEILAHAAMKYLVPLARAKAAHSERLGAAIAGKRLSTREVGELYAAYRGGTAKTRQLVLEDPLLFLKARRQVQGSAPPEPEPTGIQLLVGDFEVLGAVACRSLRRLRAGVTAGLLPAECEELNRCFRQVAQDVKRLGRQLSKEINHAGSRKTDGHPGTSPAGTQPPADRPGPRGVPGRGQTGHRLRLGGGAAG